MQRRSKQWLILSANRILLETIFSEIFSTGTLYVTPPLLGSSSNSEEIQLEGVKMANRKRHVNWGVASALTIDATTQLYNIRTGRQQEFNFWELCGAGLVGYAGGVVADVLEPATSSWHRKSFHSVGAGTLLTISAFQPKNSTTVQGRLLLSFSAAHLSHLILDSQTPRGLPWI